MTSKFLQLSLTVAAAFAISAAAQAGSPAATPGSAAAPANPTPAASAPAVVTGTRVGAINMEYAIFNTNEGRRDMEALGKKLEPKNNELKTQNDELEGLKKQMQTQSDKLNDEARATLQKQIESKQKVFDRAYQDFQEEVGGQQQEVATRILQKMAPMIVKYAQDNGFGMVIDTSKPWPQGPVLLAGSGVDITQPVIDAYNVQSGVAAPAPTGAATKPAAPKPTAATGTTAKPAAPKTTDASK